jgi:hypothetical protein
MGAVIGGIPGAAIGALVGAFMGDPDWKQLQDGVKKMWGENVSKELAKQIDADSKRLGGHVNAMLMNLVRIAEETDPLGGHNVDRWTRRLIDVFPIMARGEMSVAQAAKTLDTNFGALVTAGTATSGMVNQQITELVRLERQYKTGSAAVKEFVTAQTGMVTEGFGKIVGGAFGAAMAAWGDEEKPDRETEAKRTGILDRLGGEAGQERFERMGRLASITFTTMIASGKGVFETIEAIGPALDTLSLAQERLGLASTDTLGKLLRFRDFVKINPELVSAVDGLSSFMVGLSNLGFMTQDVFMDLGAEVTATFNEVVAGGLSGEEAMTAMHTPLQRLWEMQRMYNFELDEATQLLLDEAEASGKVGLAFMSANDRMVLGMDRLVLLFERFLTHLGIGLPAAARAGADGVNEAFAGVEDPEINVRVRYKYDNFELPGGGDVETQYGSPEPTLMAEGGVLDRPTFVAGERGAEVVMPLDRLFDELHAQRQVELAEENKIFKFYLDGRAFAEASVPHMRRVLARHNLIR